MKRKIAVQVPNDRNTHTFIFDIPTKCPLCGNTMVPSIIHHQTFGESEDLHISVALSLRCAFEDCRKFFIQEYAIDHQYGGNVYDYIGPIKYNLVPPINNELPVEISDISSNFIETYNQSLQAEILGMNQIAGIGMRKSIEFLVKDYLINVKHKSTEETKSKWLAQAIKDINFEPIKNLATAATWIGNDETHYVREWEDKDINDMKAFIRSAALFISADYQAIKSSEMIDQKETEKQLAKQQKSS